MKDRVVSGAKSVAYNHPKASCLVFLVIILLSVHFVSSVPNLFQSRPFLSTTATLNACIHRRDWILSLIPYSLPHFNCTRAIPAPQVSEILPSLLLYFVIIPGDLHQIGP